MFHPLNENQVSDIVDIMIDDLEKRLHKIDLNIKVSKKTKEHISTSGFDPVYGARPLERTITKMIEDRLAEEILKGNVSREDSIYIDYVEDKLIFAKEPVS